MDKEGFEFWAIIELFGHARIAGYVQSMGELIRVDVPAIGEDECFTKFFGLRSIYSITPTTEEIATVAARKLAVRPVDLWIVPNRALPAPGEHVVSSDPWEEESGEL